MEFNNACVHNSLGEWSEDICVWQWHSCSVYTGLWLLTVDMISSLHKARMEWYSPSVSTCIEGIFIIADTCLTSRVDNLKTNMMFKPLCCSYSHLSKQVTTSYKLAFIAVAGRWFDMGGARGGWSNSHCIVEETWCEVKIMYTNLSPIYCGVNAEQLRKSLYCTPVLHVKFLLVMV